MASIQPSPQILARHSSLGLASIQPPPPPILGRHFSLDVASIQPPSSPSPIPGRRFSLDFLPGGSSSAWEIADSHGGLLLLYRAAQLYGQLSSSNSAAGSTGADAGHEPGLVVCDPLARRYEPIPCPRDLAGHQYLGLFLLDGRKGRIGISSFRVMAALHKRHACEPGRGVPVALVFSTASDAKAAWGCVFSSSGRGGAGAGWHIVKRAWSGDINVPSAIESFYFAGRSDGCFYWGIKGAGASASSKGLVLDEATAGFSMAMIPEMMLGASYDLPVRPHMPTDLPVRDAAAAAEDNSSGRDDRVAVARTCASLERQD
ncbi:unnamed protein product [Urochloa decumbens]|uniref:Uncharacterized protein n=1 Tax=Urochloa decumbens TaxID=240449 RepID=A0ABC9FRD0_9POAL